VADDVADPTPPPLTDAERCRRIEAAKARGLAQLRAARRAVEAARQAETDTVLEDAGA
jgi:hypothetical protein